MKNPTVLETFQKYRPARWPVNCLISQDFHIERSVANNELCATWEITRRSPAQSSQLCAAERTFPPAPSAESGKKLTISARAETEDD
jgi:hypothetical protein